VRPRPVVMSSEMEWGAHASCVLRSASCRTPGPEVRGRDAANCTLEACAPRYAPLRMTS
jgi:hypothetical protein